MGHQIRTVCTPSAPLRLMLLMLTATLHGCEVFTPEMMSPSAEVAALRPMQTRQIYAPELVLERAAVVVAQDLGYQIKLSDARLGLIIGMRGRHHPSSDLFSGRPFQDTTVIVAIRPAPEQPASASMVRVQFFRLGRLPQEQEISWGDVLRNEGDYNKFFQLLQNAAALDAPRK